MGVPFEPDGYFYKIHEGRLIKTGLAIFWLINKKHISMGDCREH